LKMHNASELSSRFQEAVMLGIHRNIRRAALIAAAAVLAGSLSAESARASTIYTTDFTGFSTGNGNISGQTGGTPSSTSWGLSSSPATSTANIVSNSALQLTHQPGDSFGAAPNLASSTSAGSTFSVTTNINYTFTGDPVNGPFGPPYGPFFGIELTGNNGATPIGYFGVDATTGAFLFDDGSDTFAISTYNASPTSSYQEDMTTFGKSYNDTGSSNFVPAGTYTDNKFELTATQGIGGGSVVLNAYYDGTLVASADSVASVGNFTTGYLFSENSVGPGDDPYSSSDTASFNYYQASETSSVPEPGSLFFLGAAAVAFCGRRTRRSRRLSL
jgi:hypothetical protein